MTAADDVTHFTKVDSASDPSFFIRFLDQANALPSLRASKPLILDELRLAEGHRVLDVGCGTGADVFELAQSVGRGGRAVGLDISEAMIREARLRTSEALASMVEFHLGDAQELPFSDATFDACRSERMLLHVPDAERTLSEMVRVTRPGGRVAVFDFDMDSVVIDSMYQSATRVIIRTMCDGLARGWIGRQLPRLFDTNNMSDISVTPHTLMPDFPYFKLVFEGHLLSIKRTGAIPPEDIDRWWEHLRQAHATGTFFVAYTGFVVAGTKP